MYPTNKLPAIIRYPLAVIAAILSAFMFLGITVGALKIGEWLLR
jgi:hypothetical protein